ncbi:EthD domain-containing protein [Chloroflexota bacterium]
MIKSVAFIKRKSTITREEFARHYEEVHAPLAIKIFPTIKKYARNHIIRTLGGEEPDFDCISEFWFDDKAGIQALFEVLNSDAGKPIHDDEETFMDRDKTIALIVDERVSDI